MCLRGKLLSAEEGAERHVLGSHERACLKAWLHHMSVVDLAAAHRQYVTALDVQQMRFRPCVQDPGGHGLDVDAGR